MSFLQLQPKQIILPTFLLLCWGICTWLMVQITLSYFPISSVAGFLAIKQDEVHNVFLYLPVFYTHVITSIFVLVFGLIQVFPIKRFVSTILHRISGYLYVMFVCLLSAPSGLFIGYYANGGFWAIIAFELLGILWLFFTVRAMIRIKQKNFNGHQFDMWRSYALALSALTLRFWKVIIVYFFQPNPLDAYVIVAWSGWVLNLMLIEIFINHIKYKIYEKTTKLNNRFTNHFMQK